MKLHETLFVTSLVKRVLGETSIKISGSLSQMQATKKVIEATQLLKESIEKKENLVYVRKLLDEKHKAAYEFFVETGIVWPLLKD